MFGSVELDSLNPCRVDYVNIKVVTNLEGPFMWDDSLYYSKMLDLKSWLANHFYANTL